RDGAGAHHTYRLDGPQDLEQALAQTGLNHAPRLYTMEEFIEGHEGFFDTLSVDGQVVFEGICHYYPGVLEAMRTRESAQIVVTNRIESEGYQELRKLGRRVIRELDIETAPTHMEWFFGPRGLSFSEIGARPPGCRLWDLYSAANDFDLYTEWARAVCWGCIEQQPSRRYAAGLVSIRPDRDGTIQGYTGVDEIQRRYGPHLLEVQLPAPGRHTSPVGAGYLAHAYVWVRHPDYDACRSMLDDIGRTVHMWAS
ncbi:MAG: ATPase, partial [Myxococcota bacterium]|nr:ATPase [Myxococcota bacterium]